MILPYGPILFHDITYMAIIIMKTLFLQTMKNASCKKLIIDRSKAKKVGTLKDTSLYGNLTFPVEGDSTGGIVLRSLARMGQTISKSKVQLSQQTRWPENPAVQALLKRRVGFFLVQRQQRGALNKESLQLLYGK